MNQQLALAVQLNDELTLTDFCWNANTIIQQQLQQTLQGDGERFIYLWGQTGCGKSHLLQACCHASGAHRSAMYLPLQTLKEWGPDVLEGMDNQDLLAIDDIDVIASLPHWEEALFHLYNRIRDNERTALIMGAKYPPHQTPIVLPDLQSRLPWGLVLELQELSDEDKIGTLILQAHKRGFELPTAVGQFMLNHCARNMHELHGLINTLDQASLIAKRKITIPFVKHILNL